MPKTLEFKLTITLYNEVGGKDEITEIAQNIVNAMIKHMDKDHIAPKNSPSFTTSIMIEHEEFTGSLAYTEL